MRYGGAAHARGAQAGAREVVFQVGAVRGRYPIHRPAEDSSQPVQQPQRKTREKSEN
jgi:hypothetical protein